MKINAQQKTLKELQDADPGLAERYEKMLKPTEAIKKTAIETANEELKKAQLMGQQEELLNNLNQLWVSIADVLYPIINSLFKILVPILKVISFLVSSLVKPFSLIAEAIGYMISNGGILILTFRGLYSIISSISKTVIIMLSSIQNFGKYMSFIISFFNSILGKSNIISKLFTSIAKQGNNIVWFFSDWNKTINFVSNRITTISNTFSKIAKFLKPISTFFSNAFKPLMELMPSILGFITKTFGGVSKIGGIFSKLSSFFSVFGKFLGPIGWIIPAFQLIGNLMDEWKKAPDGFLGGLTAVGKALYTTFLQPFVDAWNWISNLFVGKSPSKLGLGIVRGLKSVATSIIEVLLTPFKIIVEGIKSLMSGVGDMFNGLLELGKASSDLWSAAGAIVSIGVGMAALSAIGLGSKITSWLPGKGQFDGLLELASMAPELNMIGSSIQIIAEAGDLAAESIDKIAESVDNLKSSLNDLSEIKLAMLTGLTLAGKINSSEPTNTTSDNSALEGKLDELINLFKSDGIAVYLDGMKVSQAIAYNT
jgi:phage-related minor tail protein